VPAACTQINFIASPFRSILAAFLGLLALVLWPFLFDGSNPAARDSFISLGRLGPGGLVIFMLIVAAIAAIPPVAAPVLRILAHLRDATNRRRFACSIAAAMASTAYLFLTAIGQHRQLFPYFHDEFSYLIQARQLARGHLWMPAHPLALFFDSFNLLVEPVYASEYFPGTALLHVPGIWLHLPPYVTSLAVAGAVGGLLFWITAELLDGLWAWVAVLLLMSDSLYRQLSIMTLAQLPLLLFALSAVVAWLRWRATRTTKSSICIGVFLGLAAITRPVDALCFALPICVAVACSIVTRASGPCEVCEGVRASGGQASPARVGGPWHDGAQAVLAVIAGMIPFLSLQMVLNHGITGHWLQTPFGLYANRDYPGTAYGFHHYDPNAKPVSPLPQKQMLYDGYRQMIRDHRPGRVLEDLFPFRLRAEMAQSSPTPFPLLALLLPLSLLGLSKPRAVVLVTLPLFLGLYAAYAFFLPHYVMVAAPAVIVGILVGANAVFGRASARAMSRFLTLALTLFIAGDAIAALPQWSVSNDDAFDAPLIRSVNTQLASLPHRPAVVLFTFDPARNLAEEPVYNADVAWPDDAEVIRAHDLGAKNSEIFRYYAEHQPGRFFYRFDEATGKLTPLGMARDLGKANGG
jgi:hypothetical protein